MIKVSYDSKGARQKLEVLARPSWVFDTMQRWGPLAINEVKALGSQRFKSPKGNLLSALGFNTTQTKAGGEILVGTGVRGRKSIPYAHIQDVGGRIEPKTKQYLTIPLGGTRGRAADYKDTFFIETKSGKLFLAQRSGAGAFKRQTTKGQRVGGSDVRLLFLLVKSVTLPGSSYFTDAMATAVIRLRAMLDAGVPK
jgi:hypothetical protein